MNIVEIINEEIINHTKDFILKDVLNFVNQNNYNTLINSCDLSKGNCDTITKKLYDYLLSIGYSDNILITIELSNPKFDTTESHPEWQKYDKKYLGHVVLQVYEFFVDLTGSQYSNNQSGIKIYTKQELGNLWGNYKIMKKDNNNKYIGGTYSNAKTKKFNEIINEEIEKIRHTYFGYDGGFDWNKYGVDNELTILYRDNVDIETIKTFLISFNIARKKIESKFKLKLGREYKDPDASYNIWFGKNIVFDNNKDFKRSAEFVRGDAEHAPEKSFYFNLPVLNDTLKFSKERWISNPNYKEMRSRGFNANKIEDMITHEIAHALYFHQPLNNRKDWKQYYDNGGWENATSLYGQENDKELFAETMVDYINNETHQIVNDLKNIFNFK